MTRKLVSALRRAVVGAALCAATGAAAAEPAPLLAEVFTDNAVVQRDRPLPVWGWAQPGERVDVTFGDARAEASAGADGRWKVELSARGAGGPYVLEARAGGRTQAARDVLVGEVFLCSGQSNMEQKVGQALNEGGELSRATDPSLRLFQVPRQISDAPQAQFQGKPVGWNRSTAETAESFSAVCFFFGKAARRTLGVPVGLMDVSWGGSPIEAWLSEPALRATGVDLPRLEMASLKARDPERAMRLWGANWEKWWREVSGEAAGQETWNTYRAAEWADVSSLTPWETWGVPQLAEYDGPLWYRTTVRLTASQARQAATLSLGRVDELDQTWVNGRWVGGLEQPHLDRTYTLPAGTLKAGENVVTVNVYDGWQLGGMYDDRTGVRTLRFADGSTAPLETGWRWRKHPTPNAGWPPRSPWAPMSGTTNIGKGMIDPLGPYPVKATLWYQGESNAGRPETYSTLLKALFADWRGRFGGDMGFLVAQLANWGPPESKAEEDGWGGLREAQRRTVLADARAGLAVTLDVGDKTDIHPANKKTVGERLWRAAERAVYGGTKPASGPVPARAERSGDTVRVPFTDVEQDLVTYSAARPIGFELCGAGSSSCRYVDAALDGTTVVLSGANADDRRVRYAWAQSPVVNLFDGNGLPAGPFEIEIQAGAR